MTEHFEGDSQNKYLGEPYEQGLEYNGAEPIFDEDGALSEDNDPLVVKEWLASRTKTEVITAVGAAAALLATAWAVKHRLTDPKTPDDHKLRFGRGDHRDNGLIGTIVEFAGKMGNEGEAVSLPNGDKAFEKIKQAKDSTKVLAWRKHGIFRMFKDVDAEKEIQSSASKVRDWIVNTLSSSDKDEGKK